jgi:hypothetical protein
MRLLSLSAIAALALFAAASPALATPFCHAEPGVTFGFTISSGEPFTEADQHDFDLMALRRHGIDATRAERWMGCIRAWVRNDHGGEDMVFFDPNTLEQVY